MNHKNHSSDSEWKEYKLREVVSSNCQSISVKYPFEEILYLDTGSITEGKIESLQNYKLSGAPSRAKRLVKQNDIIYSTVRPIQKHFGFINHPPENLVVSTGFSVIETKTEYAEPKFIYYFLIADETVEFLDVIAEASTSAYPSIKPTDIENLDINLPPLPEQKFIASVLSSLDDKIDLLHRQNKTLEQLAETLFRQWFVVEAEESWKIGTLDDEFDFSMGQSPPGESYNEIGDGIIFFQGRTDFDFRFPKTRMFTSQPSRYAKQFDTLISVRAPVGDMNMAYTDCCIGRGLSAFRYKHNPTFYSYTYYKLRSLMQQIKQFEDNGTVFGSITKNDFNRLENTIPSMELINNFQKKVKPIDEKIFSNYNQIRTLTQLRDTLLPKLMSGKVRLNCDSFD